MLRKLSASAKGSLTSPMNLGARSLSSAPVFKAGQKRLAPQIKKEMKRRSAIEPLIGHLKNDGHLGRNYLKGTVGDKINATFSGIGESVQVTIRVKLRNYVKDLNRKEAYFDLKFLL